MAKAEKITEKYVTGKGELVGFVAICTPSTKFDKEGTYSANILLPKEEGEKLAAKIKEVRTQQFKTYGKGTKVAELTQCVPYTTVNEETGEEIPDELGRYVLKTKAGAYIKDGKVDNKIAIVNAKKKPVKNVNVGAGTIARLLVILSGYSVAGKTGVSVKLKGVQIIDLVEFNGADVASAFDEEEGFDGEGEDFTESTKAEADEDDEEEDF